MVATVSKEEGIILDNYSRLSRIGADGRVWHKVSRMQVNCCQRFNYAKVRLLTRLLIIGVETGDEIYDRTINQREAKSYEWSRTCIRASAPQSFCASSSLIR